MPLSSTRKLPSADVFLVLITIAVPDIGVPAMGVPDIGGPDIGVPAMGVPDIGVPDMGVPAIGVTVEPVTGIPADGVPVVASVPTGAIVLDGNVLPAAAVPVATTDGVSDSEPSGAQAARARDKITKKVPIRVNRLNFCCFIIKKPPFDPPNAGGVNLIWFYPAKVSLSCYYPGQRAPSSYQRVPFAVINMC